MTNLEKRKEMLMKEMRELEILESQEKIRNNIAEKIAEKDRLFLSLENQPTICRMPLNSDARFKVVFNSEICDRTICFFSETCGKIDNLLNNKKSAGSPRKSSGSNIPIIKDFNTPGVFSFKFDENVFTVEYETWSEYKNGLRNVLPRKKALEMGMTTGQYSGLFHRNSMKKLFSA